MDRAVVLWFYSRSVAGLVLDDVAQLCRISRARGRYCQLVLIAESTRCFVRGGSTVAATSSSRERRRRLSATDKASCD